MGILEMALLLAGAVTFVLSFAIPARREAVSEGTRQAAREEIEVMVKEQMQSVRANASEVVDETVNDAVDRAERSLERLSNEKIMAVNEYADTVLGEINRNHSEVMFLYDMLNDKHKQLVNTVNEVQKTVKMAEDVQAKGEGKKPPAVKENRQAVTASDKRPSGAGKDQAAIAALLSQAAAADKAMEINFMNGTEENRKNSNEEILKLHSAGRSNVAIAQELGLGVGEVKLVIDLFEGM